MTHQLLADLVLTLHVAVVCFVVGGLLAIVAGNWRGWSWVNELWFRIAHLAAIAVVVAEAWLGVTCPLTSLEMSLRAGAGAGAYGGSFIEHWLQRLLYWEAPPWVFVVGYTLFGLLVAASWRAWPPGHRQPPDETPAGSTDAPPTSPARTRPRSGLPP